MRRIPRVPWHAEVRVGSHYHKLYFDALLAARSLLASLGRVDVVHAHLHDGALIGYFVSRLRRVPLVFDYQGSLPGRWSTTSSCAGEPALPPGGLAGAHHRRPGGRDPDQLHQRRRGHPRGRGGGGGGLKLPKGGGAEGGPPVAPLLDGVDVHTFDRPDPEAVAALRARYGIRRSAWWWATWGCWPSTGVGDLIYAARG